MKIQSKKVKKTRLTKIGNSRGVILPKIMLLNFHIEDQDEVTIMETPDGILITPYDADFEKVMKVAREVMHRRRNLLRALSK